MATVHILNPQPKWAKQTEDAIKNLGASSHVVRITQKHPHHTDTVVDWALSEGAEHLVIWGGDGTINRVVRALFQRKAINKVAIGIAPVGTCNDTARFLGLSPGDIKKALDVVKGRRETAWSVGLVNGIPFLNNAGFGRRFDEVNNPPYPSFKKGGLSSDDSPFSKGGNRGIIRSSLVSIWQMRPLNLEAVWKSGKVTGQYLMGLICNAPYFSGGLRFSKNVSPFDRELDVFLVKAIPKPRLIFRLWLGRMGLPLQDNNVTNFRTSGLNIRFSEEIWPQTDGEPPDLPTKHMVFGVLDESLRVFVPK